MPQQIALLTNATTAPTVSNAMSVGDGEMTVQATGSVSSGTGSATVEVQVSNDGVAWLVHDTITLALSTARATAGVEMDAPWAFIRTNLSAISGIGAAVTVTLGV